MLKLGKKQLGIAVGYALVTVAAHLVSRGMSLHLLEPWFNPVRAGIVAAYAGREEVEDVLVVGTSRVDVGLDARLVQAALDERFDGAVSHYKLGVPGLGLRFLADLAQGVIARRPPKRLLVVDIDPRSFLAKGAARFEQARLRQPFEPAATRSYPDWKARLHDAVESAFLGLKKCWNLWWLALPEPRATIAYQRENRGERFTVEQAEANDRRLQRQYDAEGREAVLALPPGRAWVWQRNSDPDLVAFRELLDTLERLPCEVVFVRPPLEEGYPETWMPGPLRKYQTQVVPRIEERFRYHDLNRDPYPRTGPFFMAKHHLNRRGCEVTSPLIVEDLLAPLLEGGEVRANP